jgi:lipoyl(octanoyl) transferase
MGKLTQDNANTVFRIVDLGRIAYGDALRLQKTTVRALRSGDGGERLFLLEHPHVVTLGRNASGDALRVDRAGLRGRGIEVAETDRGGDVTYHGPGQLVGYPILALEPGRRDIRRFVADLEEVLLRVLDDFGISGRRHPEHRGVWTGGRKIASVGIRIARWVTSHGFALNVGTDLSYFSVMKPCGIEGCEMTSMARELGADPGMGPVKEAVAKHFHGVYGRPAAAIERPFPGKVVHS